MWAVDGKLKCNLEWPNEGLLSQNILARPFSSCIPCLLPANIRLASELDPLHCRVLRGDSSLE